MSALYSERAPSTPTGYRSNRSNATRSIASSVNEQAVVPTRRPDDAPPLRTLDDVRAQISEEIALRTVSKGVVEDGVKLGVRLAMSKTEDEYFLRLLSSRISHQLTFQDHLFAVGASQQAVGTVSGTLIVCASSPELLQRAVLLIASKFMGRILDGLEEEGQWIGVIQDLGVSSYDELAIWDVLRKASRTPIDPMSAPAGSRSIDQIVMDARARLQRIDALQASEELRVDTVGAPTFIVDIRSQAEREQHGVIYGALQIERNIIEWLFDPRSPTRLAIADRYDLRVILISQDGLASSLAAYSLHQIGLLNATDIIGGFEAWSEAGLPIEFDRRESLRSPVSLAGSFV